MQLTLVLYVLLIAPSLNSLSLSNSPPYASISPFYLPHPYQFMLLILPPLRPPLSLHITLSISFFHVILPLSPLSLIPIFLGSRSLASISLYSLYYFHPLLYCQHTHHPTLLLTPLKFFKPPYIITSLSPF